MAGLDSLLTASVDAVKKSGALEQNALMATVSVVNSNGTVDCTRAGDTYPSVRVLSSYQAPAVGHSVELLRSAGGWVCIGSLRTTTAPRIQTGTAVTPAWSGAVEWTEVAVTFPKPFGSTPTVVATPVSAITSGSTELEFAVDGVTASGFQMRSRRSTSSVTTFNWIATDY
ncbi:hypothetical protein HOS59_gp19 [Streptomyces phage Rowa]|uniref:H-type lectin domain-containing protein n=1 Tax=Streptomyces phage Rowa TaxID=2059883 RepID=A0A2H5BLV4_9CAUD|nr:hypothetical protein HOS59_gp19 [Streptomyces phage Rowa]AUG87283.1 hypothetical protein SEA_ROWA_19 [Streptomyces phage Rowa]